MHVTCNFNSNATRKHRDFRMRFRVVLHFVREWNSDWANSHIRALGMSRLSIDAKLQWRETEKAAEWVYRHQTGSHFDDAAVMTHKTIHKAQAKCLCVRVCTLHKPRPEWDKEYKTIARELTSLATTKSRIRAETKRVPDAWLFDAY